MWRINLKIATIGIIYWCVKHFYRAHPKATENQIQGPKIYKKPETLYPKVLKDEMAMRRDSFPSVPITD